MEKSIHRARATEDGLIFYSNINPHIGIRTFRDPFGQVKSYMVSHQQPPDFKDLSRKKVLAIDFAVVFLAILSTNPYYIISSLFFSIFASYKLFDFISIACQLKFKLKIVAKFHATEHMIVNAYEKLQRIPTVAEVRKFSRLSKKCGSRILVLHFLPLLLFSIVTALCPYLGLEAYFVIIILIFPIVITASNLGWLNFFQFFLTSKPSDSELELAIEALKSFEGLEKSLMSSELSLL